MSRQPTIADFGIPDPGPRMRRLQTRIGDTALGEWWYQQDRRRDTAIAVPPARPAEPVWPPVSTPRDLDDDRRLVAHMLDRGSISEDEARAASWWLADQDGPAR